MGLTSCQETAIWALTNFIEHKQKKDFILSGNAGTGKTYLIADILLNEVHSVFEKIYILAPTNKALEVIQKKVINSIKDKTLVFGHSHKINFRTIASFLNKKKRSIDGVSVGYCPEGYEVLIDPKTKTKYFGLESKNIKSINADFDILEKNPWYYCNDTNIETEFVDFDTLIIIDEVSMVDKLDHEFIVRGNINSKRIYLGDQLQLPAIDNDDNECISHIFTMDYPIVNMTTIKRTKIQSIGDVYQLTRDIIGLEVTYKQIFSELKKQELVYSEEFIEKEIIKDLEENNDFCVLSYTGIEIDRYNKIISKCLNTCKSKKYGYFIDTLYISNVYYNKKIKNNTSFIITDVYKKTVNVINEFYVKCYALTTNKDTTMYVLYEEEQERFDIWLKSCKLILRSEDKPLIKNKLITDLIALKLTKKYKSSEEQADITLLQLQTTFMKREPTKKDGTKPFAICYSMSIYKSQGSSIQKCYVNLVDIFKNRQYNVERKNLANKMKLKTKILYVATTRATDTIRYF